MIAFLPHCDIERVFVPDVAANDRKTDYVKIVVVDFDDGKISVVKADYNPTMAFFLMLIEIGFITDTLTPVLDTVSCTASFSCS